MRIAVIAPPWASVPPARTGGVELVINDLALGFQASGHDVLLFTTGDSTCPVPKRFVYDLPAKVRGANAACELRHVLPAYEGLRDVDIVHDHTVSGPVQSVAYPHLNVVTTMHEPLNRGMAFLYRHMSAHVDLVAISRSQMVHGPEIPLAATIPHGLDASRYPFGDGAGGYLVWLGRVNPDKGVQHAITVAEQCGAELRIAGRVGTSWERSFFEAEVAPRCKGRIEYVGELGHDDKVALLGGARALCFPSRWHEPFGMVQLEAMACGTPVLAFPMGSAPEIVRHGVTGFLCRSELDMIQAAEDVDQLDRRACRADVDGCFSAERMVADYLTVFETILGREGQVKTHR